MLTSLIASVYWFCDRGFRVLHAASLALFEGFWMGILPESVYDAISERSYGDGGYYVSGECLDSGFHFWEDLAIRTYFAPGARVLVAAAGGGREMIALARAGFQPVGFECSRAMVEAGKRALAERGIVAPLEWAPPSTAPPMQSFAGGEAFDAAIVGWNGYTYILPRARRMKFLQDLRAQMRHGAPVLVSTIIRHNNRGAMSWTSRVANAIRICTFRPPVFATGDVFECRPKTFFLERQIKRELTMAGFSVTEQYVWGDSGAAIARA